MQNYLCLDKVSVSKVNHFYYVYVRNVSSL